MNVTSRAATTAALVLAVVLCSPPRDARADYLFVPFIGAAFAGNTAFLNLEQGAGSTQWIFGGSAGWLSSGVLGFEGDFSYAPRFFERDNLAGEILSSNVTTLTGSVIIAVPQSVTGYALRPYLVGGVGLMHSGITYLFFDPVDDNSLGLNIGGGAIGFLSPRTGVRFEVRHFRTLEEATNPASGEVSTRLSFWRFTVGIVIRR